MKQIQYYFRRFLAVGSSSTPPGRAVCALRDARTLMQWNEAENAGLVRLKIQPERESYFDVYGKPDTEKERKQIEAELERNGCWYVCSEVNAGSEASGDKWDFVDGVGMCVYENPMDPFDNCYVIDLMRAALEQIPQPGNVDELCTALESD